MNLMIQPASLAGHLLIATPALQHPAFRRTVILVCAHSKGGALGVVLNRPTKDGLHAFLRSHGRLPDDPGTDRSLRIGGPSGRRRGFVIHDAAHPSDVTTIRAGDRFRLSSADGALSTLAVRKGPVRAVALIGHAAWKPGQLRTEILDNSWFTTPATEALVFAEDPGAAWGMALHGLGIRTDALAGLSAQHGHA